MDRGTGCDGNFMEGTHSAGGVYGPPVEGNTCVEPLVWDVAPEKARRVGRHCLQEPTGGDSDARAPVFVAALFIPAKSQDNPSVH